jgi:hypothetical protein
MKKYIYLEDAIKLLKLLVAGKRVQGVLYIDENTGKLTYKPYYSRGRRRKPDRLIVQLEHGWVRESKERIKVFDSIPKEMGMARVMSVLDREIKDAKNALIDRELDLIEFC